MKIIVEYDPISQQIKGEGGALHYAPLQDIQEYHEVNGKLIATLVEQGYTAKDLINLKESGVI